MACGFFLCILISIVVFNIVTKSLAWKKKQWPGAAALLKAINSDMGMYPNRLSLPTAVFVLGALFFL